MNPGENAPPGWDSGAPVPPSLPVPMNGDDPFSRQLLAAMLAFRDGNFSVRLPVDMTGIHGKIADAYGVRREAGKNMARRASFLIGLDGKIAHVTDVPSADVHLAEMKEAVGKLAKK